MSLLSKLRNYMIPAIGSPTGYPVNLSAGTSMTVDFRTVSLNNDVAFTPTGFYAVNTSGLSSTVDIDQGFGIISLDIPAGTQGWYSYPGSVAQTATITSQGGVLIVFVDFPVVQTAPTATAGATTQTVAPATGSTWDVANATGTSLAVLPTAGSTATFPVSGTVTVNGGVTVSPASSSTVFLTNKSRGASSLVTATGGTLGGRYLRELRVSVTGDATLATAGETTITVTCNGTTVFEEAIYLGTAASNAALAYAATIDYSDLGFTVGVVDITLSTALATGKVQFMAFGM